jgi:hypothetical protein
VFKQVLTGSSIVGMLILGSIFTPAQAQQQPPASTPQTEAPLPGQPEVEVNRESLQQFVVAVRQIQTIEQEAQRQIVEVVEEQGFSLDRFNETISVFKPNCSVQRIAP